MKIQRTEAKAFLLGIFLSGFITSVNSAEEDTSLIGDLRIQPQERSEWMLDTWFSSDSQVVLTIGSEFLYHRQEAIALWNMSNGQRLWYRQLDIPKEAEHFSYEVKVAGFSATKDPVLEVHKADKVRSVTSIVVLDHRNGKTRYQWEVGEESEIRFDKDRKRIHEVSEGRVVKSYDVENGEQVATAGTEAAVARAFDGRWEQIEPGAGPVSFRLGDRTRQVRVEGSELLIDGRHFLALSERMEVFHSPEIGGRAYLHVRGGFFDDVDSQLIDLSNLSAVTIPHPTWPEGVLTLSSSPSGRIFGRTAMHQNQTSDSSGDQFFGEVYASGTHFIREPWPNGVLLHGSRLIELIDDRFLILGSSRLDQSDVRVRRLFCLDLLELRLRWSVAHNHNWTDQALYSNGR